MQTNKVFNLLTQVKMKKLVLLVCVIAFCCFSVLTVFGAKGKEFKFGKISSDEMNAKVCPIDSNAHAYYLFDVGDAFYVLNNGFQIKYERHFRIKILDKSGLDYATITIPYYDQNGTRETVNNLKAFTYNLENGEIVKTQLEKDDIFDEETTKNWRQKKFALPNVKEGSVVEVRYSVSSDFIFNLPGWQFQYEIPVMYSSYNVNIPEYLWFNQFHRGYVMAKTTTDSGTGTITQGNGQSSQYSEKIFNYEIENVPAFPVGEELTTPKNYVAKVVFELASIQVPGSVYKNYTTTWADVNELFLDSESFGGRLKMTDFLKDSAAVIKASSTSEMDKMRAALNMIKKKMKWDEYSNSGTSKSLKKSFELGIGNSADINLNLVALLKEVGLTAFPVVLSTRSNGMIHPTSPSIDQMNYVIAMCRIEGTSYLMDATDRYSDINILPARCMNDKGWIVDKDFSGWETLARGKKSKESTMYNLSLSADGVFTGTVDMGYQEFKALQKRNTIKDFESEEKYIEKLQESNEGLNIKEFTFQNLDTSGVDLKSQYTVEITDKVENAGDLLYFTPLLFDGYEKNPFSLEKREYPVEYAYPFAESVVVNIDIPEGFTVESLPPSKKVTSLGNACQFNFKSGVQGNKITITSTLQVNQTIIVGTQYQEFKGFFEEVVKKHLEKVVLKKI
jgi:hypothetical protein